MPEAPTLPSGPVLAFDVGARRIGVAVGSREAGQARPVAVVMVHDEVVDWAAVDRQLREWRPAACIVGDPMDDFGNMQPSRIRAHAFARALQQRSGKPVWLMDERYTSLDAAQRFAGQRASGQQKRGGAEKLDAVAAALILERWLATPADATPLEPATP